MLLLPDNFDYIGPQDLTEYNVRRTEITRHLDTAIRVKVKHTNKALQGTKLIKIQSSDRATAETSELVSDNIPADPSY